MRILVWVDIDIIETRNPGFPESVKSRKQFVGKETVKIGGATRVVCGVDAIAADRNEEMLCFFPCDINCLVDDNVDPSSAYLPDVENLRSHASRVFELCGGISWPSDADIYDAVFSHLFDLGNPMNRSAPRKFV